MFWFSAFFGGEGGFRAFGRLVFFLSLRTAGF